MSASVNPQFIDKVKKLGAFDINACFSCGNCTAICPLSDERFSFPRRMIRYALLGLEEKILSSPELWLCYYCGECSDTCPREADPGGLMMALRRYAIRKYSLGKIADLFYNNLSSALTWLILTLAAVVGIVIFHEPSPNLRQVAPLSFISLDFLHTAGLVLGAFIGFFAIIQIFIMASSITRGKARSGPLIKEFFRVLFNEVFVQRNFTQCEEKKRYVPHLALFWGFTILFLATILAFGTDFFGFPHSFRLIARLLGIVGGFALLYGAGFFTWKRLRATDTYVRYSHHSDWIFILLMLLAGFTGLLMDLFHLLKLPWPTYITFGVHLVIVFDLLVGAPFSKFAHAIYRPLALWLAGVFIPHPGLRRRRE